MSNSSNDFLETENNEFSEDGYCEINRYDINAFPADYAVKDIVRRLKEEKWILPDFQRRDVWDKRKKSRLIESILLGLPIPQIFLFKRVNKPSYYIIDGYQRLKTLRDFLEGDLKLSLDESPWNGLRYSDLSEEDRTFIEEYLIRAVIIQQIRPENEDSSMYHIFERLNTGGVVLTPMEIRRAVYHGKFLKLLEKLNENSEWRKIIGKRELDKRFRDLEWVLRFFAFYLKGFESYKAPLKIFLNKFMEEYKDKEDSKWERIFANTTKRIIEALGEKPFHIPRGKLNLAVMDCIMVAVAKKEHLQPQQIKQIYDELKNNEEFLKLITARDTNKTHLLKKRFRLVFEKFGVL